MKILIVLTSHSELGDTGKKTGFWVEEFAAPYYELADAGAEITLASPKGGQPPIDPSSELPVAETKFTHRFDKDEPLKQKLAQTLKLRDVKASDFDAVFYPGGHGPMWDLVKDTDSIALIEAFQQQGKPMALVCHAPCALLHVNLPNGDPLIKGKNVTGFSDTEEAAVKLTKVVPFLLEDELKKAGGHYSKGPDWGVYLQTDGKLITGQNPASSAEAAKALLKLLMISEPLNGKPAGEHRLTKPAQGAHLEFPVIAMAASVGGLKALSVILGGLPADFPAAIAIVMHVAPDHKSLLAGILKCRTPLQVAEAHTGDVLAPSKVYVAPPNHHLFVVKGNRLKLSSPDAEKIHFARPSAEPLFASVAEVYGKNAIAVVLTGGDGDGSFGVQIIKDKGGTVLAQDRPTSENFSMPETSIRTGDVDHVLPLNQIAPMLIALVRTWNESMKGRPAGKNK